MDDLKFYRYYGEKVYPILLLATLIFMNFIYFSDSNNDTSNFLTDSLYITLMITPLFFLFFSLFTLSQIVIFDFDSKVLVIKNRFTGKRCEIPFTSFTNTWAISTRNGGFFIYASTIEKKKVQLFYQLDNDYYKLLRESLEKETGRLFPLNLGKPIN